MKIGKFLMAAVAACSLAACGEDTTEPQPQVKLEAHPAELVFDAKGGSQELTLTSGIPPQVSCSDAWITLKEGNFASNTLKVTVTAASYEGTSPRSTSIRVIGEQQSLMIPVTQNVAQVKLSVDKTSAAFANYGGEFVLKVSSSTQPTVSTAADWVSVETGKIDSARETTVTLFAAANRTASVRQGTLTVACGDQKVDVALSEDAFSVTPASAEALTPQQVFDAMAPGWNMGNHMDAISNGIAGETVWGNAKCTQATFNGLRAAGFKAVRICTSWQGHIGDAPGYRLEEKWLSRVEEIVGYAEKAGLVAIVNTHHDESYWLDIAKVLSGATTSKKVQDQIFCVWTQIAQRFADKGEWLVFESFNEIQDGGWGWSDAFKNNPDAQYRILNDWNQAFVDAVRYTGGENATRWLGIPGYAASPQFTIPGLVLPQDYTGANRLMVAVHDYDPYNYTLSDPLVRRWGHTAEPALRCSDKDEENLVWTFDQLKETYIDKGIPVYLGEMGCSRHLADDLPFQEYYMEYFCKAAADRLLPMYLWDNGASGTGPERHGYIDHGTGAFLDEYGKTMVGVMVRAVTTTDPAYTLESVYNSAP
ncbi:MAG: cellulase family glycosylhydrolase [Bacteroidales bacterium]|nr:cellulase family glycosylhydrolase [Bacteroidales bacterium]